jgi:hypothetical protein
MTVRRRIRRHSPTTRGQSTPPGTRRSDQNVVNGQVSRYGQTSPWGAVLGCIRPSRSPCASMAFVQLSRRVMLRLGTRFGASIRGTNLLPRPCRVDSVQVPNQAGPGPWRLSEQTFSSSRPTRRWTRRSSRSCRTPATPNSSRTGTIACRGPQLAPPQYGEKWPRRTPERAIRCLACRAQKTKRHRCRLLGDDGRRRRTLRTAPQR